MPTANGSNINTHKEDSDRKVVKKSEMKISLFIFNICELVTKSKTFKDIIHSFSVINWVENFVDFFLSEA